MASENSRPTAVVAGGGPAGALTAKVLAERGFNVHLYETYPHPGDSKLTETEKERGYAISVNPRGHLALKRCGVDPLTDLDAAVVSEAVVQHDSSNGKVLVTKPDNDKPRSVYVRRGALAASLLRTAEKAGAEINCGWRLKDINFEKRQVTLVEGTEKEAGTNEKTVDYDLLVGADGVQSRTRTLLSNFLNESREEGFSVKTAEDTMEYQVAILSKPWKDLLLEEKANTSPLDTCPPASLHSWADQKMGSTALCFPIRESNQSPIDKFLVCVIFPGGVLGKMKQSGFNGYTSALSTLFADWTPDSRLDLARLLAEDDNIPSTGGVCVWSQALSHPESGVVLMGDAGHAMFPSLGQGCNAALESVSVLADAIEAINGSVSSGAGCRGIDFSASSYKELVEAIAEEYDGLRRDDALAVVDLTYGGIGQTKASGALHSPLMFKAQMMMFMSLHKLTFGLIPLPAMIRIMKGDSARYSTLKWENKVEKYVVHGTAICILVFGFGQLLY